jgi:ABC-type nitrate/sulfonate/bicarbonate transport system substrate-binding protein
MRRITRPIKVGLLAAVALLLACAPAGGGSPAPAKPAGQEAAARGAPAAPAGGAASGAGGAQGAPAAPRTAAQAPRPLQPVQVATTEPHDMAWIIYAIAIESGIAEREGYALELLSATTNVAIPAIMNGDMGYTAQVASAMRAAAQGLSLRVVAMWMDAPLQSLVVRPNIRQASDLIGQPVGVSTSGATAHLATVAMLETLGVPESQVNWVFLGAQSARFAALEQGLVQGAAIVAPLDMKSERDQGFRILVRASDVIKIPFVGLATSTTRIQEKPDEVKGLLRTALRTIQFIRDQPEEANVVAARWLQTDDLDLIRRSMDQVRAVLTSNGLPDAEAFRRELGTIERLANLPSTPQPDQVADFRLLEEVQRELGLR